MQNSASMRKIAVLGISLIAFGLALPLVSIYPWPPSTSSGDGVYLKGKIAIVLYDESGQIKDERHIDNLIVDAGLEGVASRIAPHDGSVNPGSPYNHIALGTGSAAVDASQTALDAELPQGSSYSRVQDAQAAYTSTSGKQLALSAVFGPGEATGTISESGIFNSATGGDMLARQTFTTINKGASDTLTVTWTITLSTT